MSCTRVLEIWAWLLFPAEGGPTPSENIMYEKRKKQNICLYTAQEKKNNTFFLTLFILVISLLIRNLVLKDQDSFFLFPCFFFLSSINIKTQTYIKKSFCITITQIQQHYSLFVGHRKMNTILNTQTHKCS